MSDAGASRMKSTVERSQTTQERPKFRHRAAKSAFFTQNDLHRCLYGRNQVMLVSKDELIYSLLHEEEVKSYCKFLVSSLVSRHFKERQSPQFANLLFRISQKIIACQM